MAASLPHDIEERPSRRSESASPKTWLALAAILLLAAALRFTGLGWGLRHSPEWDELAFVESARQMLAAGDFDHRFYEYPGLFPYVLRGAFSLLSPETLAGAGAYLAARRVVAAFGVASVGLVFLLGGRLMDARAGLMAALLLAVSPLEVATAHMVRPDVVLEAFVLLALLAFRRVGPGIRHDLVAGAALGAAAAAKFTGALLVPSYLLSRAFTPGHRVRGALVAGAAALAIWLALTPYALIAPGAFASGVQVQWDYHYRTGALAPLFLPLVRYYLRAFAEAVGLLGIALAALGLAAARREWRSWLVLLAYPIALLTVLSTAEMRYQRLVLSTSGVLALLASRALHEIGRRRPAAAWLLAGAAIAVPVRDSATYVLRLSRPLTWDRALDWIEAHVPRRSRMLTTADRLGIDRRAFEVLDATGVPEADRTLALHADYVVHNRRDDPAFAGLHSLFVAAPETPDNGEWIAVSAVPEGLRPRYRTVCPERMRLAASSNTAEAGHAADGRLDTQWTTAGPQRPGDWLEAQLDSPILLGRVELKLGGHVLRAGQSLRLLVAEDGVSWRRVSALRGRPPVEEQAAGGRSHVMIVGSVRACGVRIELADRAKARWAVAELRLDALDAPALASLRCPGGR